MAKTIEVTATQVNAARLLVKQATARGESVPPAVAAMADATPVANAQRDDQASPRPTAAVSGNGKANGRAPAATQTALARPRFAG